MKFELYQAADGMLAMFRHHGEVQVVEMAGTLSA